VAIMSEDVPEDYLALVRKYSTDVVPRLEPGDVELACVKLPRGLEGLRLDLLAVPVTLDDILGCFLRNLVHRYEVREVRTDMKLQHLKVFAPLYRVPRVDLVTYAFLVGLLDEVCYGKAVSPPDTIGKLVSAISIKHPELLFRFLYGAFLGGRRVLEPKP